MPNYYVNNRAQSNGDHEVHKGDCTFLPSDKTYLGNHPNCRDAVRKARGFPIESKWMLLLFEGLSYVLSEQ